MTERNLPVVGADELVGVLVVRIDVGHLDVETVSPDGRWLLSAGWLWHPVGTVGVYDLVAALEDPIVLDRRSVLWDQVGAGVEAACWLDADRLLVSGHPEDEPVDGEDASLLAPGELGVWSLSELQPEADADRGRAPRWDPAAVATTGAIAILDLPSSTDHR